MATRENNTLNFICSLILSIMLRVVSFWCWSWNSSTLATWCEELTHWKRPWCWERLRAWGDGDGRGWDCWMASLTRWTWVWVDSGGWWWTGRPGVLWSMGSQRIGHDWATELNWAWNARAEFLLIYASKTRRIMNPWFLKSVRTIKPSLCQASR